ncbi:magnesium/cobalt transporter CorA [Methanothrix sp.]|uniref:magnesium/cobalt transporter CorA n=1 Tax=Methanothrix sp. TaxID=90426 RepID=UPI0025E02FC5|nr:magnesium/cobalt transporter CorA [Methanothrix sp.]
MQEPGKEEYSSDRQSNSCADTPKPSTDGSPSVTPPIQSEKKQDILAPDLDSVPVSNGLALSPEMQQTRELPRFTVIEYDENHFIETETNEVEDCLIFRDRPYMIWINVDCPRQVYSLEKLGACYGLHPLVLEDILTDQRPKVEDYEDYIFIVLKMLYYEEAEDDDEIGDFNIDMDQVSIIFGKNFIISFKEKDVDIFRPLRERLRTSKGRIRKQGADYLAYSMIDSIVDHYFVIMEKLGDRFEELEDSVVSNPEPGILPAIYNLKRDMLFLRKSVWPLREAISRMQRMDSQLISETTRIYLRDVYDHTIQVIENIETFRDMSASLLETYLSSLSNKLNEVIKLLTIISTIFIPLTFLAGLYGMNFTHMPELEHPYGYPAVLVLMLLVVAVMLAYFYRKKWI